MYGMYAINKILEDVERAILNYEYYYIVSPQAPECRSN